MPYSSPERAKTYKAMHYEAHKETILAQQKEYREANKEKIAEYQKAYREANKEKIAAYLKDWHVRNKDYALAQNKAWREANREAYLANGLAYYQQNGERMRAANLARYRANPEQLQNEMRVRNATVKLKVMTHYSGGPPQCACCGESISTFLAIDHIDGNGNTHRKSLATPRGFNISMYRWLIKNNFPEGFQVLCYNCNLGKRICNNVCPHQGGRRKIEGGSRHYQTTAVWQLRNKTLVMEHYGKSKCACCGESEFEFLTIDHAYGGGRAHLRAIRVSLYPWLIKNNFPEGFRVLCSNCNRGVATFPGPRGTPLAPNICPHQRHQTSVDNKKNVLESPYLYEARPRTVIAHFELNDRGEYVRVG
jgi:hypothetical protein